MFCWRSVSPVSSVISMFTFSLEIAMQVCPAASPYPLPVGPAAPVSLSPHVVLSSVLLVFARSAAYGSDAERIPWWSSKLMPRYSSRAGEV